MAKKVKLIPVPVNLTTGSERLCSAMAKKFVDASGAPHFQFTVEDGHLCAEGDAWAKKANERPAHGTMASYAEGYVNCYHDLVVSET